MHNDTHHVGVTLWQQDHSGAYLLAVQATSLMLFLQVFLPALQLLLFKLCDGLLQLGSFLPLVLSSCLLCKLPFLHLTIQHRPQLLLSLHMMLPSQSLLLLGSLVLQHIHLQLWFHLCALRLVAWFQVVASRRHT